MTDFVLRPWAYEDLDKIAYHANNYNIAKFLTDKFPHPYTRSDAEKFFELAQQYYPSQVFVIEYYGEPIGSIGIFPQDDIMRKNAELGYWLAEPFWGKGIVPEAIRRMITYGFETFDINRIFARPFSNNPNSIKVLEKVGFVLEARIPFVIFKNEEYLDELIYAVRRF